MTHDSVRDALEYAALLLEQQDAGGTLPGRLRQIADVYDDLLAACEAAFNWIGDFGQHASIQFGGEAELSEQLRAAIAAARGEGNK